jgi:hypothetical protein
MSQKHFETRVKIEGAYFEAYHQEQKIESSRKADAAKIIQFLGRICVDILSHGLCLAVGQVKAEHLSEFDSDRAAAVRFSANLHFQSAHHLLDACSATVAKISSRTFYVSLLLRD